jgi:hypothetical protein
VGISWVPVGNADAVLRIERNLEKVGEDAVGGATQAAGRDRPRL